MTPWNQRILALVIGLCALAVLFGAEGERSGEPQLSASTPGPWSARALYLALLALEAKPSLDYTPPLEWPAPESAGGVRLLLSPSREFSSAEARAVVAWVEAGGSLGLSLDPDQMAGGERLFALLQERLPGLSKRDFEGLRVQPLGAGKVWFAGLPEEWTGVALLAIRKPEPRRLPWLGEDPTEESAPPGAAFRLDRGPALVLALLEFAAGRGIRFDETAHGFGSRIDPLARLQGALLGTPLGHSALTAALLGLLALLAMGARRGPLWVEPPTSGGARSSLEHAAALAELWRAAKAPKRIGQLLLFEAAQRLRTPLESLPDALARHCEGNSEREARLEPLLRLARGEALSNEQELKDALIAREVFLGHHGAPRKAL